MLQASYLRGQDFLIPTEERTQVSAEKNLVILMQEIKGVMLRLRRALPLAQSLHAADVHRHQISIIHTIAHIT